MDWIDDNVAVGNWFDGFSAQRRRRNGIELIIDSRLLFTKSIFPFRRIPIKANLTKARDQIQELLPLDSKVLIFCNRGRDRSAFLAMMYVMRRYEVDQKEAFRMVKSKRRQAAFHSDWAGMLGPDDL
jgi:protein-tyrosine phosphatase